MRRDDVLFGITSVPLGTRYLLTCVECAFTAIVAILCNFKIYICTLYRVSQEERTKLREGVSYVKLHRYNPKHLYPKLNGYGDNGK